MYIYTNGSKGPSSHSPLMYKYTAVRAEHARLAALIVRLAGRHGCADHHRHNTPALHNTTTDDANTTVATQFAADIKQSRLS